MRVAVRAVRVHFRPSPGGYRGGGAAIRDREGVGRGVVEDPMVLHVGNRDRGHGGQPAVRDAEDRLPGLIGAVVRRSQGFVSRQGHGFDAMQRFVLCVEDTVDAVRQPPRVEAVAQALFAVSAPRGGCVSHLYLLTMLSRRSIRDANLCHPT